MLRRDPTFSFQMDDWTKRFQAGWLVLECLNRENEVADAALMSSGDGELWRVKNSKMFGKRMILFIDTDL
jgi:hypothetical protein